MPSISIDPKPPEWHEMADNPPHPTGLLNIKRELEEELKIAAKAWPMDSDHGAGFVRGLKRALFHVRVELGETSGDV